MMAANLDMPEENHHTMMDAQKPPPEQSTSVERLQKHLITEVTTNHADILLLTCCLISGLVDSTIYNAYGTFVSMQTGNTIFLGLGGSTPHTTKKPYGWAKSLTSIGCFCLGCFCFSHGARLLGPLRRGTLVFSFLLQSLFILVAAAVVQASVVNGTLKTISDNIDWRAELPIALLSFQSAGQITGSRMLNLSEIPSVVLTSMLCDLASDPKLASSWSSNVKRNRRALAFFGILVGAVAGGFISEATGRMQIALWIAGGLKVLITCAWMWWPERRVIPV